MTAIISRMQALITYLNYHQELYDMGCPIISDKEWDDAYFQLQELERQYPRLINSNSPTQKIKYVIKTQLEKVQHECQPMLSLAKTKNIEEVKSFMSNKDCIAMLKLDGLTCRLTYEEGKLVRAETRGNGIIGEDITHNAMVIPSIPKKISYYDTLIVDGEVICDLQTFKEFDQEYANARNFAAGSIRLLDSAECARRKLTFVAWDIITEDGDDEWGKLNTKFMYLINYGFIVVPFLVIESVENQSYIDLLKNTNDTCTHYPIDGIVFKWNNCAEYEAAGRTDHHFRGGLAYKFYDETYQTKLTNIEFTMGRTGVLTPVAIYKDIEIDGAICNRASLHNLTIMEEVLGEPYIDQEIEIYKANAIIPQVSSAIKRHCLVKSEDVTVIIIPSTCPICGEPLARVRENDSEVLMCQNEACEGRLLNRLDHFCSRKGLDIRGLSKATLEKLIDWGWVNDFTDIFQLSAHRDEWMQKPGFGVKSVDNILAAIETARAQDLDKFIVALGIPLIGITAAKELTKIFSSWAELYNSIITEFKFYELPNFGMTMHSSLVNYDYTIANELVEKYITIKEKIEEELVEATLSGMNIVVTGTLTRFSNRAQLTNEIVKAGGKVTSSVSKNTNILINNNPDSTSSKNIAAKNLNIPILTEEEFCSKYLPL